MANQTELMNATGRQLTLPTRRSPAYAKFLIVEIGKLAVVIGQQQALDSDGIRQATMAEDLIDTRPDVMLRTLARLRKECRFLPATTEVLDVYAEELRTVVDAEKAAARLQREAEAKRDHAARPEDYVATSEVMAELMEIAGVDSFRIREERREAIRAAQQQLRSPQVNECPHCGKEIPFSGADLTGLSADSLRSIADVKDARAATKQQARQQFDALVAKETQQPNAPRKPRRKKAA